MARGGGVGEREWEGRANPRVRPPRVRWPQTDPRPTQSPGSWAKLGASVNSSTRRKAPQASHRQIMICSLFREIPSRPPSEGRRRLTATLIGMLGRILAARDANPKRKRVGTSSPLACAFGLVCVTVRSRPLTATRLLYPNSFVYRDPKEAAVGSHGPHQNLAGSFRRRARWERLELRHPGPPTALAAGGC